MVVSLFTSCSVPGTLITDLFSSIMIASNATPVPFEAYSGEGSYTFVSYAHADKAFVYECMDWLRKQGVDMWYDEGIAPAGEWVEEIDTAIKGSTLFIVFISPARYAASSVSSSFLSACYAYFLVLFVLVVFISCMLYCWF